MLRPRKLLTALMILVLIIGANAMSGCKELGKKANDGKTAAKKGVNEFVDGYCEGEKEKGKKSWPCED